MGTQNYQPASQLVKLSTVRFDFDKHPHLIFDWFEKRGLATPEELILPKIGYVVLAKNVGPVVIGFLRGCEGNVGMIDSIISNPEIAAEVRDEAIDFLINRLVAAAFKKNIFKVFGFSEDANTLKRAERHGFKVVSQTLVALSLS